MQKGRSLGEVAVAARDNTWHGHQDGCDHLQFSHQNESNITELMCVNNLILVHWLRLKPLLCLLTQLLNPATIRAVRTTAVGALAPHFLSVDREHTHYQMILYRHPRKWR